MTFIHAGVCNKRLFYPIIGGIFNLIVNIIIYLVPGDEEIIKHPFILGMNSGLGMSFSIIPFIYSITHSKLRRRERLTTNKMKEDIKKRNDPGIKREKYIIIILCAFLDFIQKTLIFFFSKNMKNINNVWIFNIIFLNAFALMMKENQLYIHHYISGGIMILCGLGLNVFNLYDLEIKQIPLIFVAIFIEIIFSLEIVLAKYGMDYRFCSPSEMTFYEGIFSLIINTIFLLISTYIPLKNNFLYTKLLYTTKDNNNGKKYLDNIIIYYKNINFVEIIYFIVIMAGRLSFNLFSYLTIKHFTSSHVFLLLILGEFSLYLIDKSTLELIITIIIYLIELLMALIFCEIIELDFLGLSDNTKRNIKIRATTINLEDTESYDSEEIWNGLELSSDSKSSLNNSYLGV
jgi:hypothetical protein